MSYLHNLYLDSFQTTKRHSYEGYSIYIAILSSFLQGVYPVDVTDLQPYYTPTICHNSMNNHWIPTKLGTANSCNTLFKCAKFQLNWSTHSYFMVGFAKCAKRRRILRKKMKKLEQNFGHSYLENVWNNSRRIWYVDSPNWPALL